MVLMIFRTKFIVNFASVTLIHGVNGGKKEKCRDHKLNDAADSVEVNLLDNNYVVGSVCFFFMASCVALIKILKVKL